MLTGLSCGGAGSRTWVAEEILEAPGGRGHRGLLLANVIVGLALLLIGLLAHRLRRFVTHGRRIMGADGG
jgi:hypothetical protein